MFCSQCGAELPEDARFCSECGSVVERPMENDEMPKDAGEALVEQQDLTQEPARDEKVSAEQHASFAERLLEFRRTTLKAVPTFVLAIVAFLASAVTAYAAYRVVTEVVVPAIEHVVEDAQQNGSDKGGNGDAKPVVAKGKPKNMLQLGEILAMDPADIPDFLESQGLVYMEDTDSWVFGDDGDKMFGALKDAGLYELPSMASEYSSGVEFHDEIVESALVQDDGSVTFGDGMPIAPVMPGIAVGEDILWENHFDYGAQLGKDDLIEHAPQLNSIRLEQLPLLSTKDEVEGNAHTAGVTDEDLDLLCSNILGLGKPLAIYRPSWSVTSNDWQTGVGEELIERASVYASGTVEVKGKQLMWYVQYGTSGEGQATVGVLPLDIAQDAVVSEGLYTEDEWNAADASSRAGMFSQSLAMEMLTGNGETIRLNYRTGEYVYPGLLPETDGRFRMEYRPIDEEILKRYGYESYDDMAQNQMKPLEGTIIDFTKQKGPK